MATFLLLLCVILLQSYNFNVSVAWKNSIKINIPPPNDTTRIYFDMTRFLEGLNENYQVYRDRLENGTNRLQISSTFIFRKRFSYNSETGDFDAIPVNRTDYDHNSRLAFVFNMSSEPLSSRIQRNERNLNDFLLQVGGNMSLIEMAQFASQIFYPCIFKTQNSATEYQQMKTFLEKSDESGKLQFYKFYARGTYQNCEYADEVPSTCWDQTAIDITSNWESPAKILSFSRHLRSIHEKLANNEQYNYDRLSCKQFLFSVVLYNYDYSRKENSESSYIDGVNFPSRLVRKMYLLMAEMATAIGNATDGDVVLEPFLISDEIATSTSASGVQENLKSLHDSVFSVAKPSLRMLEAELVTPMTHTDKWLRNVDAMWLRMFGDYFQKSILLEMYLARSRFQNLYIKQGIKSGGLDTIQDITKALTAEILPDPDCYENHSLAKPQIYYGFPYVRLQQLLEKSSNLLNNPSSSLPTKSKFFVEDMGSINLRTLEILPFSNSSVTLNNTTFEDLSHWNLSPECSISLTFEFHSNYTNPRFTSGDKQGHRELVATLTKATFILCERFLNSDHSGKLVKWDLSFRKQTESRLAFFTTSWLVVRVMNAVAKARDFVRKDYDVEFIFTITMDDYSEKNSLSDGRVPVVYCGEETLTVNSLLESVITNAKLLQLPVIIGDLLEVSWWKRLRYYQTERKQCSVFVTTDRFVSSWNYDWLPLPCMAPVKSVPEQGIPFSQEFSGTTLNLEGILKQRENQNGTDITEEELMTLLIYTFHKFRNLEIIFPKNITQTQTLAVLRVFESQRFAQLLEYNKIDHISLRLEYDLETPNLTVFLRQIQNFTENHRNEMLESFSLQFRGSFSNKRHKDDFELRDFCTFLQRRSHQCGMMIGNCNAHEKYKANMKSAMNLIGRPDYVVCKGGIGNAYNHLDFHLDTHIYQQQMFQRMFPGIPLQVRFFPLIHKNADDLTETQYYLKVATGINVFASTFKIPHFIFSALETDYDGNAKENVPFGWWRVAENDFGNLANVSVYNDKESKYFYRPSWRTLLPVDDEDEAENEASSADGPPKETNVLIISFSLGIIILILGVIFLHQRRKLQRAREIISKMEADEFFNGNSENDEDEDKNDKEVSYFKMRYKIEFELPNEEILFGPVLGKGNFGVVHKATYRNETVAVKITKEKSNKDPEHVRSLMMEVKILCYTGEHENVLRFIGANTKRLRQGKIQIITEYCENGSLESYLREKSAAGNFQDVYQLHRFCQEIASGMKYISEKSILHGDLSSRNVFLDSNLTCKVGDFGLSRKLNTQGEYIQSSVRAMPWRLMALESLKEKRFTVQSDIWGFGVTVWEIYSLGAVPYPNLTWSEEFIGNLENGVRLGCPVLASDQIHGKMLQCWDSSPEGRPSYAELIEFFRSLREADYDRLN